MSDMVFTVVARPTAGAARRVRLRTLDAAERCVDLVEAHGWSAAIEVGKAPSCATCAHRMEYPDGAVCYAPDVRAEFPYGLALDCTFSLGRHCRPGDRRLWRRSNAR